MMHKGRSSNALKWDRRGVGERRRRTIAMSYYAYYLLETRAMVLVNFLSPVVGPETWGH